VHILCQRRGGKRDVNCRYAVIDTDINIDTDTDIDVDSY